MLFFFCVLVYHDVETRVMTRAVKITLANKLTHRGIVWASWIWLVSDECKCFKWPMVPQLQLSVLCNSHFYVSLFLAAVAAAAPGSESSCTRSRSVLVPDLSNGDAQYAVVFCCVAVVTEKGEVATIPKQRYWGVKEPVCTYGLSTIFCHSVKILYTCGWCSFELAIKIVLLSVYAVQETQLIRRKLYYYYLSVTSFLKVNQIFLWTLKMSVFLNIQSYCGISLFFRVQIVLFCLHFTASQPFV